MAGPSGTGQLNATTARQPDEIQELSDAMRQALECPVCMEVSPSLPEVSCSNGHSICIPCLEQMSGQREFVSCPICRSPVTRTDTGRQLLAVLPSIRIACRYRQQGCDAVVPVTEVAGHEAGCWYLPDVRCMVAACHWLGTHDSLYEHVCRQHPDKVATAKNNRLVVTDIKAITINHPRVYLAKTNRGDELIWIMIKRVSSSRFHVGVFVVGSRRRDDGRPIDLNYRVTADPQHYYTRSMTHRAGRLNSSLVENRHQIEGWSDVKMSSYDFTLKRGRLELKWFVREFASVHEIW